jgi:ParB family chromosome partitioning protein
MAERETMCEAQHIAVDLIHIANPRVRSQRAFDELVSSIASVGLKRPITVAARPSSEGLRYDLVCGQGRLEAFRQLGQPVIPAVIVEADAE